MARSTGTEIACRRRVSPSGNRRPRERSRRTTATHARDPKWRPRRRRRCIDSRRQDHRSRDRRSPGPSRTSRRTRFASASDTSRTRHASAAEPQRAEAARGRALAGGEPVVASPSSRESGFASMPSARGRRRRSAEPRGPSPAVDRRSRRPRRSSVPRRRAGVRSTSPPRIRLSSVLRGRRRRRLRCFAAP